MAVNPMALLGGVGAVALGIVGGIYVTGSGTSTDTSGQQDDGKNKIPGWRPASDDTNANNDYGANKYANKYQRYLVGVDTKTEAGKAPANNDEWWEWSYNTRLKNEANKRGKFKTVTSGKDATGFVSLKSVCAEAYKAETGTSGAIITDDNQTVEDTKFKESDIWSYCSFGGTKIKTLSEVSNETYGDNQYGHDTNNRNDLVATHDTVKDNNKWFWDLKEEELKKDTNLITEENKFKKLKDVLNKTSNPTNGEKTTLRELCKEAYGQATSENGNTYMKTNIFKYCSLSGTSTN